MILGHIELSSVDSFFWGCCFHSHSNPEMQLTIPTIPAHVAAPVIDPRLVLRAIHVVPANDLDLDLWNSAIEDNENPDIRVKASIIS
jgi:hypothetical protein